MGKLHSHRILIIDDEKDILEMLRYNLEREGYKVRTLTNGQQAVAVCKEFNPALVILDIMMPKQDGVETCRQIRKEKDLEDIYIVFLTARSEEYSEVAAFDIGGDDYIIKPIRPRALLSRIQKALMKKKPVAGDVNISIGDLTIDSSSFTINLGERRIEPPKKEFELLHFLARNPNTIYSRDILLREIWGNDVDVASRTVDVHVRKIREKIGDQHIRTIKGVGYKFVSNDK